MPWHEGELEVQTRAGVRAQAERVGAIIGDTIPAAAARFLAARAYLIVRDRRRGRQRTGSTLQLRGAQSCSGTRNG